MSISGIQGQLLEVTVVGCNKLKDTEWISRQDPYVCLEYGSTKYRTRTCTDGGKNPTFQEKFVFTLIEGLRELSVVVWNSNTISLDDFIGSGKIQLQKVLSQGFDDSSWPLQDKRGRHAGEVRVIVHYSNANKPGVGHTPSAAQYSNSPGAPHIPSYSNSPGAPHMPSYSNSPGAPHIPPYSNPPGAPHVRPYSTTPSSYPPTSFPPPAQYPSYPPTSAGYPPSYHQPAAYPPSYPPGPSYPAQAAYPPPTGPHLYPPSSYPPAYPPTTYPPPTYPPPY